jgi:hypothetical protein
MKSDCQYTQKASHRRLLWHILLLLTSSPFTSPTTQPSGSAKRANVTISGTAVTGTTTFAPRLTAQGFPAFFAHREGIHRQGKRILHGAAGMVDLGGEALIVLGSIGCASVSPMAWGVSGGRTYLPLLLAPFDRLEPEVWSWPLDDDPTEVGGGIEGTLGLRTTSVRGEEAGLEGCTSPTFEFPTGVLPVCVVLAPPSLVLGTAFEFPALRTPEVRCEGGDSFV